MTALENNRVHSEKYALPLDLESFGRLQLTMQYIVLEEANILNISFPSNGYLNIMCPPTMEQFSYTVDSETLLFEAPQNIIHYVKENQCLQANGLCGASQAILIFIPETCLSNMFDKGADHVRQVSNNSRLLLIKSRVLKIYASTTVAKNIRIHSLLLEALALQLDMLHALNASTIQAVLLAKILQAQQLIENDLAKTYTISELAKAVGTNEQYLKKYFKQHLGKTIMHYALEAKMLYAKKLITTGDFRIADVARMTGYKHATHFSMSFKKFFGFLPTSLRYSLLFQGAGMGIAELNVLAAIEACCPMGFSMV
ncbi:helix-turn-helix domain-containing protein [Sphingobacterium griseoflavum]|uniref:HTH araC/xylS-type domain-containing protein n=1 Tax=Sphingobacterium griseoflavum TaxID=1474952 RepID=A0ABQ3HRH4_9SPHI|nr:AraC family transcriptional regulator [Sphingobacterium griseoflavum]GHE28381.1 hypothetical protein GCM10017764_08440 [Sphingobacterium griseoflavum]